VVPQTSDEVVQRFLEPGGHRHQQVGSGMGRGTAGWAHMAGTSVYITA
jgi:hypothetical protein